ncbi:hybrid sensor histidine kinase/response regulator [Phormidium tenue FACHB-886]|nr:hybrid sensor histidine kinase/response regulator [Phormidium tenue FACHB-886]
MTINPDIRDHAYQFFVEEAPELLQAIETELLGLNQERSTVQIHHLMRTAHSLKGGAASVGLDTIATLAHRLENIFKALYSESLELNLELEGKLLQAYDCLRLPLMEQITTGSFDSEQALAIADPLFNEIEAICGDALTQTQSYIPSSAELGVDMVVSIFEVDVAQGLDRLMAVVADPFTYEVAGELRAQTEVFAGFAELLNLSEFGEIAATVQRALELYPDRALEIAQLAIADFEASRQMILVGGTPGVDSSARPSAALAALAVSPIALDLPLELGDFIDVESIDVESIDAQSMNVESIYIESIDVEPIAVSEEIVEEITEDAFSLFENLENIFGDAIASFEEAENNDFGNITEVALDDYAVTTSDELTQPASEASWIIEDTVDSSENVQIDFTHSTSAANTFSRTLPSQETQLIRSVETATAAPLTVRVDAFRLEKMNNLVGELTINRDALSLQNEQLQSIVKELLNRFAQFQGKVNLLRQLSDQLAVPERYSSTAAASTNWLATADAYPFRSTYSAVTPTADFDALEMDSYGALHPRFQDILETVVQLEETVDDVALFARQSNQLLDQQRNRLSQLQDEVIWSRMLPLGEVINRFPRILRDLSITHRKPAQLKLVGTGVLIEKAILEKLYDPLLHLLRNAFDHGIESAELRQERGKPEQGQIEIRAYHKGNQTIIEIEDDGQGLDLDRIGNRALQLNWVSPDQLAVLTPAQLLEFIFEPGFSTASQVSELSGRGVGLDVVRSELRSLKGTVTVASTPGKGTTFTLSLPLTLTITRLMICLVGSSALALSADCVEEVMTPQSSQVSCDGSERFLDWREHTIPIYRLADLLDYACPLPELPLSKAFISVASPQDWALPLLILRQGQQLFALEVDQLVTEQELVVKPFGAVIAPPAYAYGCTILADGSLVAVIDGIALLSFNRQLGLAQSPAEQQTAAVMGASSASALREMQIPTLLVVDDAVALRRTLALSLERAGFRVLQARDGREAIAQLQKNSAVKLVVCDIEMPNMNGFEFLTYRRQDPELAKIPVVMLTSRSNEKHRWLARQLGATDYFTKPYLEQEFLTAIGRILDEQETSGNTDE